MMLCSAFEPPNDLMRGSVGALDALSKTLARAAVRCGGTQPVGSRWLPYVMILVF